MINLLLDWKSMGSLFATLMFIRTAVRDFLPPEVIQVVQHFFVNIFSYLQPKMVSIQIQEFENGYNNDIFDSVQCYLSDNCFYSAQHLKLSRLKNSTNLSYTMIPNQSIQDIFNNGINFKWSFHVTDSGKGYTNTKMCYFQLSFHSKYKQIVHTSYLPHIMSQAGIIKFKNRGKKLYSNQNVNLNGNWSAVAYFTHPSTFDTIAMDPILKQEIKDDLKKFINRREYYNRVGRAWKRGYLLYGPPGTGKTSLIAAIANFLEFDIYDLELTAVKTNSQLKKLLISTTSKSVIVVEDIDCSLDLSNRKNTNKSNGNINSNTNQSTGDIGSTFGSSVSLSGVLNFVDGLWSSCGGERLIIFTTNHKEKLDPALLRPGRMDKQINLSYCDMESFKILVKNYLKIEEHEIMKEVEKMLGLVKMTPADVAEFFMSCDEDAEMGLKNVVKEMKKRLILQSQKEEKKEEMKKEEKGEEDEDEEKNEEEDEEKNEEEDDSEEEEEYGEYVESEDEEGVRICGGII
ncbi:AAA+ ATPase domain [Macleaya cordata]|uniref:AAA+ ATPase domain n=1 Tax=Macleaya cordata TaxID=56857 RepID=A0A200QRC9_MACCD|nr:AAA+ ATPase domain [Macleaya cordata]